MRNTAYHPNNYDLFMGIDVHKNSFSFTIKDKHMISISKTIPAQEEMLYAYIQKAFPDKRLLCTYETGPTGFHLHNYLRAHNIDCIITPAASVEKAANERIKNDKRDSQRLAQQLSNGDLMHIRVPDETYTTLRHLVNVREEHSTHLRQAKQKIKSLLLYEWLHQDPQLEASHWSRRYVQRLKTLPCSEGARVRLDHLIQDMLYFREHLAQAHKELRAYCKKHESISNNLGYLTSIPGVGFVTAVIFLANVGDPIHLKNPRELGSFVGVVPSEHSSGERVHKGGITHLGNHTLRSTLIEVAWIAIKKDVTLAQFFHRIKKKHPPKIGSRIAIVAVARKLTLIMYRVLKDQRIYHA